MTKAGDKLKLALEEAINVVKCEHDFWPLPSTETFEKWHADYYWHSSTISKFRELWQILESSGVERVEIARLLDGAITAISITENNAA